MKVPLLDLKAQYETIKTEVKAAIDEVIESQRYIMGPHVASLEAKVAEYTNAKHAVGVASGSDALLVSFMAMDLKPGDEVITTPYTFFATAGAIARLGATPVFVDINPKSYNIDPDLIEDKVTSKTRAMIPVHLYGQSCDMDPIMEIARKHKLIVVEDAAQAIGTEYNGRRVGSIGDFGCFSFFPSKNLGGLGDGGMITTNDDAYAEKLRVLRLHGSKPKYYHKVVGLNSRLDAINAAVLEVKLTHLDEWSAARKRNADWYNNAFKKAGLSDRNVVTPYEASGGRHIYNQYVLRAKGRDELMKHLKDNEIGCEIYYPVPLHLQECFADLGYKENDCPVSEEAAKETLAIPVYPELSEDQRTYVAEKIAEFYK